MEIKISYSQAVDRLLATIPELMEGYRDWQTYWKIDPPLADPIYADVFAIYVRDVVEKYVQGNEQLREIIERAFGFLETLAGSDDFNSRCLVEVSVLESLLGEKGGLELFIPFMGPRTKAYAEALVERWGRVS